MKRATKKNPVPKTGDLLIVTLSSGNVYLAEMLGTMPLVVAQGQVRYWVALLRVIESNHGVHVIMDFPSEQVVYADCVKPFNAKSMSNTLAQ